MAKAAVLARVESASPPAVQDDKPSYLAQFEGQGNVNKDNFDQSDVVIPQIKLLQGLSKECEAFDAAKAGLFWHTGFDIPLGAEIQFVVCSRRKRFLLVAPIDDGQGILARADDFITWDRTGEWKVKIKDERQPVVWKIGDKNVAKSGLDQWGTYNPNDPNSPPAATLFYDYLILLPERLDLGPAVMSLTRSQIKRARKGLNDKIQLHGSAGRPMQALNFIAKSVGDRNSSNQDFKNWMFTGAGFVNETLFNTAREYASSLQQYRVQDEAAAAFDDQDAGGGRDGRQGAPRSGEEQAGDGEY